MAVIADKGTRRTALIASILGSGIVFLDSTIVNVALPAIRSSLHGGLAEQQWVVEAYLLTLVIAAARRRLARGPARAPSRVLGRARLLWHLLAAVCDRAEQRPF